MDERIGKRNAEGYIDMTAYKALTAVQKGENDMNYSGIYRGDIFWIHKSVDYVTGSKSEDKFPGIIISSDETNTKAGFFEVVYIKEAKVNAQSAVIPPIVFDGEKMEVHCGKINTIGKEKIGAFVRVCTASEIAAIDKALLLSLGLSVPADNPKTEAKQIAPPPAVVVYDDPAQDQRIIKLETEKALYESLYRELLERMITK